MPIAPSSLARYEAMRKKIVENCGENYKPEQALEYIKKNYPNVSTQNGYFAALRYFAIDDDGDDSYYARQYTEYAKAIRADKERKEKSQKLPEARVKKMLTWPELQQAYHKAKELCEQGKLEFDKFLLVALYTQINPIRADWAEMKYIKDASEIEAGKNYCLFGTTELNTTPSECKSRVKEIPGRFILQEYKSSKKYGRVDIEIPRHLDAILRKHWNGGGFGGNNYVYKGTSNSLCHAVSRVFEQVTGKATTISLIRHARVDDFYKTDHTIGEKEDLARSMLHSSVVGERYRTAVNPEIP